MIALFERSTPLALSLSLRAWIESIVTPIVGCRLLWDRIKMFTEAFGTVSNGRTGLAAFRRLPAICSLERFHPRSTPLPTYMRQAAAGSLLRAPTARLKIILATREATEMVRGWDQPLVRLPQPLPVTLEN